MSDWLVHVFPDITSDRSWTEEGVEFQIGKRGWSFVLYQGSRFVVSGESETEAGAIALARNAITALEKQVTI